MSSGDQKAIIDAASAIQRMGGDEELYREVLAVFFDDVPKQLELLRSAFAAKDMATAERQAHSLKSAAGNIGADEMRDACLAAERAFRGKSESVEKLGELCEAIYLTFERVLAHSKQL